MKKAYIKDQGDLWPVLMDRGMMKVILHATEVLEFLWNSLDRRLSTSALKVYIPRAALVPRTSVHKPIPQRILGFILQLLELVVSGSQIRKEDHL